MIVKVITLQPRGKVNLRIIRGKKSIGRVRLLNFGRNIHRLMFQEEVIMGEADKEKYLKIIREWKQSPIQLMH